MSEAELRDESKAQALQRHLINKFQARSLSSQPYFNDLLDIDKLNYLIQAKSLNTTVRVFFLQSYLEAQSIVRLITHIPYICTSGDSHIVLQNQRLYHRLTDCKADFPGILINNEERRMSRKRSIASYVRVLAIGGYGGQEVNALDEASCFDCIVVSGAGPQFEARYLDYADFIFNKPPPQSRVTSLRLPAFECFGQIPDEWDEIEAQKKPASASLAAAQSGLETPLPAFLKFGPANQVFHVTGYMASMRDCIHLWLSAFNELIATSRRERCGYFKLVAIGTGFFADVAGSNGVNLGKTLQPLLLRATLEVLSRNNGAAYPYIAAIEFPDFSSDGLYTPQISQIGEIRLVAAPYRDVLDFPEEVKAKNLIPGVLNPGDCFAFVGNEHPYASVEAMIGNNTTLRINQNYIWNENILDEGRYVPVDSFQ